MADITMCDNQKCDNRKSCYRVMARESDWQSWQVFNYGNSDHTLCAHFVEVVEHKRKADKAKGW